MAATRGQHFFRTIDAKSNHEGAQIDSFSKFPFTINLVKSFLSGKEEAKSARTAHAFNGEINWLVKLQQEFRHLLNIDEIVDRLKSNKEKFDTPENIYKRLIWLYDPRHQQQYEIAEIKETLAKGIFPSCICNLQLDSHEQLELKKLDNDVHKFYNSLKEAIRFDNRKLTHWLINNMDFKQVFAVYGTDICSRAVGTGNTNLTLLLIEKGKSYYPDFVKKQFCFLVWIASILHYNTQVYELSSKMPTVSHNDVKDVARYFLDNMQRFVNPTEVKEELFSLLHNVSIGNEDLIACARNTFLSLEKLHVRAPGGPEIIEDDYKTATPLLTQPRNQPTSRMYKQPDMKAHLPEHDDGPKKSSSCCTIS